jgi:hypothetical protein
MVSRNGEISHNGFRKRVIVQTNPDKFELAPIFGKMSAETGGVGQIVFRNRCGSRGRGGRGALVSSASDNGRQDL